MHAQSMDKVSQLVKCIKLKGWKKCTEKKKKKKKKNSQFFFTKDSKFLGKTYVERK